MRMLKYICPNCKTIQEIPKSPNPTQVKCFKCNFEFIAEPACSFALRLKKSKFWYILGVITTGLILFFFFFRVVILPGDFIVIAKKHPTFSNTLVNLDDYIKRSNQAVEEYNMLRFVNSTPFEDYLRNHSIDPELYKELREKGLIVPKEITEVTVENLCTE